MFTGIVSAVGTMGECAPLERGMRIEVRVADWDLSDVAIGDSIAVNGACLTVVKKDATSLYFDVSAESLRCTHSLDQAGSKVNLEKALRLADRLGGHLVSGHVDGVGTVKKFEQIGESWGLVIRAPQALAKFIAAKGSITVDGVSLTVNTVNGEDFSVNIIPHTLSATNFSRLAKGVIVNLEVDLIARYVERLAVSNAAADS